MQRNTAHGFMACSLRFTFDLLQFFYLKETQGYQNGHNVLILC
jgi:hypothetical protein